MERCDCCVLISLFWESVVCYTLKLIKKTHFHDKKTNYLATTKKKHLTVICAIDQISVNWPAVSLVLQMVSHKYTH